VVFVGFVVFVELLELKRIKAKGKRSTVDGENNPQPFPALPDAL